MLITDLIKSDGNGRSGKPCYNFSISYQIANFPSPIPGCNASSPLFSDLFLPSSPRDLPSTNSYNAVSSVSINFSFSSKVF